MLLELSPTHRHLLQGADTKGAKQQADGTAWAALQLRSVALRALGALHGALADGELPLSVGDSRALSSLIRATALDVLLHPQPADRANAHAADGLRAAVAGAPPPRPLSSRFAPRLPNAIAAQCAQTF
jgi:hypothetical protein